MFRHQHTTITTTNTGRSSRVWGIVIAVAILSIAILILTILEPRTHWNYFPKTFFMVVLTCGFLLGFALPMAFQRFLHSSRVDVFLYVIAAVLTIITTVASIIYLIDNQNQSLTDTYRLMIAITICMGVEIVLALVLLFVFSRYA